jgi:tetratricopeptide (TPR) repeat protein
VTKSSNAGARPPRHGGGQSVSESIVFGDIFQVEAAGDVVIRAEQPPYRVEDFLGAPVRLSVAKARAQPSRLLLTRHAVVPFTGREQQLRDQATWLASRESVAVRLVYGAGGQGKTRLASRIAVDAVSDGWQVWQALHGVGATARLALPTESGSLLTVVDYADRWPASHLTALVRQLHSLAGRVGVVVRVLLLARSAGFWWSAVANEVGSELGIEADDQELEPLGAVADRAVLFDSARDAFAAAMDLGPVGHIQAPDRLGDEAFAQVLAVHMAALAAVDAYHHADSAPTDPESISTYLLRRERAYWHELHARTEDKLPTAPQTMGRAVYVATLVGALPRDDAQNVLTQAGVTSTLEKANQLLDDHRTCYPPVRGDVVLEPLHPDRLGEDFLALTTPGHAREAAVCDDWAATAPSHLLTGVKDEGVLLLPGYTAQAVSILIEVARRWPHVAQGQLYPLLRKQPWLALVAGSAAMTRLADLDDIDIGVLEAIEQLLPSHHYFGLYAGIAAVTQRLTDHRLTTTTDPAQRGQLYAALGSCLVDAGLREQALIACSQAVDAYRPMGAATLAACEPDFARALSTLAVALAQLGRREEALAAAKEAVGVYRRLTGTEGAGLAGLAMALANLSNRLSDLGRRHEALTAASEAVEIRRQLGSEPDLAVSLIALGAQLSDVGRVEEGLVASNEAVDIFARLPRSDSAMFDPDLAIALNNIGMGLARLGRWEKAQAAMSATVDLRRQLATAIPAAFESALAGSLNNLGGTLSQLRRHDEALVATTEAVEVYRQLAQENPATVELDLAGSLINLGGTLSELGRRDEALVATTEAVAIYRRLAQETPATVEPDLARALSNLSIDLSEQGRRQEALAAVEEAVEVYRRLAQENPVAFDPNLAEALLNQGAVRFGLKIWEAALAATSEAVEIYRRLAQVNPATFDPRYATALGNLSLMLILRERQKEALTSTSEAVEIYRRLAQENPAVFRAEFAHALLVAASVRYACKTELPQALTAAEQAAAIYQDLAVSHPAVFADDLTRARDTVARILDSLSENEEPAGIRNRRPVATSRVVIGNDIQEELDEVGLAQVKASLYPVDCQTCGLPIGSAQAVLHVDDFGAHADAALHHSGCKASEWNRASSAGVLIIRDTFSEACLSWTCLPLLLPINAGYLPMLLVNPGLEAIQLGRNPSRQWRVQMETQYRNSGLTQNLLVGEPIEGATARIANGHLFVKMRTAPFQTYGCELSDQHEAEVQKRGGLIFAVTHAVNPADVSAVHDLEPVFAGDRSLIGWVGIETQGSSPSL